MTGPVERFIATYYRLHPVNATFTGVHDYDDLLPDWSPAGLERATAEMKAAHAGFGGMRPTITTSDGDLARGYLEIRMAEDQGSHGIRRNPALWTGEAVFAAISLMLRPSLPMRKRAASVAERLNAVPAFLASAKEVLGGAVIPEAWIERALKDCEGARLLLDVGMERWVKWLPRSSTTGLAADLLKANPDTLATNVTTAAAAARAAFAGFAEWLRTLRSTAGAACGPEFYDLLLTRGHFTPRTRKEMLAEARTLLAEAESKLVEVAKAAAGSWEAARERLEFAHPTQAEFLAAFERTWSQCRMKTERHDIITWPDWPIRYVIQPEWAHEAAPHLYFLPYRAPAPEDSVRAHDYLVAPIPVADADKHLRVWNHAAIKLNHVVHHGALGHHIQNWFAYNKCISPIGRIAAVDCANRIGMFCGGTMAEGWACYATEVMEEVGFLTPLEKASEQHSRIRFLARAIVDIELHQGSMGFADATRFYVDRVGMTEGAAQAEATKNSMYPGTGLMYWLGTREIMDLRAELKRRRGAAFNLKAFHEELLSHGSVPVPLVARRMLGPA
jgi:uncharacterized protein (DUF885 family)